MLPANSDWERGSWGRGRGWLCCAVLGGHFKFTNKMILRHCNGQTFNRRKCCWSVKRATLNNLIRKYYATFCGAWSQGGRGGGVVGQQLLLLLTARLNMLLAWQKKLLTLLENISKLFATFECKSFLIFYLPVINLIYLFSSCFAVAAALWPICSCVVHRAKKYRTQLR